MFCLNAHTHKHSATSYSFFIIAKIDVDEQFGAAKSSCCICSFSTDCWLNNSRVCFFRKAVLHSLSLIYKVTLISHTDTWC